MQYLSARLQVIFDLVPMGALVADIGTDHAYLPIALSKSGKAKSIIACDVNSAPLSKAKKNITQHGISNIETRLGDGLSPIKYGEANTVVIAGMGGEVIKGILSACPYAKSSDILFLLQPMTAAEVLRMYLMDNGFDIETEIALTDNSKVYSVMAVRYSGIKRSYPPGYEYIGKLTAKTTAEKLYINKQLNRLKSCYSNICALAEKHNEAESLKNKINGIIKVMEN